MRIYWYFPHAQRTLNPIAARLAGLGHDVTVHSLEARFGEAIVGPEVPYHAVRDLPETALSDLPAPARAVIRLPVYVERAWRRDRALRRGSFDVCHLQNLNHFVDPALLGRLSRHAALVSAVQDVVPHERRVGDRAERRLLSSTYQRAGRLLVYHEWMRVQLAREFDVPAARVDVVPHPVEMLDPPPEPQQDGDPPTVLAFGRLRANKGIEVLIEAVRRTPALRDARIVIAGSGSKRLEELVRSAATDLSNVVAELGYITPERKRELYRQAQLVVLPYTSFASQSGVLHDAYAYAVPVVVSEVGSLGPTVQADRSGWVVPPSNAGALGDQLVRALEDRDRRAEISLHLPDVARSRAPDACASALVASYERAIEER